MLRHLRLSLMVVALLPAVALAAATPLQVESNGVSNTTDTTSLLQPSAAQTLQSGDQTAQQSTGNGLTAPSDTSPQSAPASGQAVNDYLNGELTGDPQTGQSAPASTHERTWWGIGLLVIVFVVAGLGGSALAKRDRNRSAAELLAETPPEVLEPAATKTGEDATKPDLEQEPVSPSLSERKHKRTRRKGKRAKARKR